MELSELVKIKPGTIIWATIEVNIDHNGNFVVNNEQEVCLKVESVLFIPSRKDFKRIQLNFSPIELSGDTESTILENISIFESKIVGSILCKDDNETWCSGTLISSIELE